MKINNDEIRSLIKFIGYLPEDGSSDVYYKNYTIHNNYIIRINFNTKKIEYRSDDVKAEDGIRWGDLTTSNFENSENFVVLECIDRLLVKGYKPNNLYLEYKFPLGRNEKGKLDILVLGSDGKAYLMIECKTWGTEFVKEQKKMLKNGGQLFSYYVQDKATKYLCLYTSRFNKKKVEYKNNIIKADDAWVKLTNQKEIHDHWNKNYSDNGIFETWTNAYNVEMKALVRERLQPMTKDDSSRIFNQFAEILRHNVVSDKPNAFNKMLNLFICKIIDEDKNDDEQVEFQWLEGDTDESLQIRLNDLYKKGMHRFLDIDVTDFTENEIKDTLVNVSDNQVQKTIKDMFIKLRLQKNPEFAFIEVYDDNSFKLNARVVREVVELLQPYQFRYGHKQQFLGDFFELLLNTSIKQESGQYFTPAPITRYIIYSLPIKEFIDRKLKTDDADILPSVIDFACGTGHFLTEYMDRVQSVIENDIDISKAKPSAKMKLGVWKDYNKFEWAREYVYGIDADYRLVKSAKVSSFLNGDGEANIIRANGLDHFIKSEEYKGKLKLVASDDNKNNAQFDVLIANPPYSVSAFKSTVKYGEESFELFDKFTDNSSEIECLFVERMKQLLKVEGWAGIILPITILSNSGIYAAAREIILKYFKIVAITEFGTNTFMKTTTSTVTLFLERRSNTDHKQAKNAVDVFFDKPKDVTVLGIEKAFSKYVLNVFDGVSYDDYISFISGKANEAFKQQEIFIDYQEWFDKQNDVKKLKESSAFKKKSTEEQTLELEKLFYDKVLNTEKEKVLYFLLTFGQKTVITKSGEKQAEKEFLGYEFSERRGRSGIKMLSEGTKLYDENDQLNPEKASSYVYRAFRGEFPGIDESLQENISYAATFNLLDLASPSFGKTLNLNANLKLSFDTQYPMDKIGNKALMIKGITYDKEDQVYGKTNNAILTADNISLSNRLDIVKEVYLNDDFSINSTAKLLKNDILVCQSSGSRLHIGKSAYIAKDMEYYAGGFMGILRKKPDISDVLMKYVHAILSMSNTKDYLGKICTGTNIKNLNDIVVNTKIPIPPIPVQQAIISRINEIDDTTQEAYDKAIANRKEIDSIILGINGEIKPLSALIYQVTESTSNENIGAREYVNTNTMLPECNGIVEYTGKVPNGKLTKFQSGDILLSNIRPYLKKLWVADFDGGCSPDVLVFRGKDNTQFDCNFVSWLMKQDIFFSYVMENVKGLKMPRGKVEHILTYKVRIPSTIDEQKIIADKISILDNAKKTFENKVTEAEKEKQQVIEDILK
jgi:type I restriction enzyme M protein